MRNEKHPTLHLLGEFLHPDINTDKPQAVEGFRRLIGSTLRYDGASPSRAKLTRKGLNELAMDSSITGEGNTMARNRINNVLYPRARNHPRFRDFFAVFAIYRHLHRSVLRGAQANPRKPDTPFDADSLEKTLELIQEMALERYGINFMDWQIGHCLGMKIYSTREEARACPRLHNLIRNDEEAFHVSVSELDDLIQVLAELFEGTFRKYFLKEPKFSGSHSISIERYVEPILQGLEARYEEGGHSRDRPLQRKAIRRYIGRLAGVDANLLYRSPASKRRFATPSEFSDLRTLEHAIEQGKIKLFDPRFYGRVRGVRLDKDVMYDLLQIFKTDSTTDIDGAPALGRVIGVQPEKMRRVCQAGFPDKAIPYEAFYELQELVENASDSSAKALLKDLIEDPLTASVRTDKRRLIKLCELLVTEGIVEGIQDLALCIGMNPKVLKVALDPDQKKKDCISSLALHQLKGLVYLHQPKKGLRPRLAEKQYNRAYAMVQKLALVA